MLAVLDLDHVAGPDEVARDVELAAVDQDVAVADELAGLGPAEGEAEAGDDVVEPALEQRHQRVAGVARCAVGPLAGQRSLPVPLAEFPAALESAGGQDHSPLGAEPDAPALAQGLDAGHPAVFDKEFFQRGTEPQCAVARLQERRQRPSDQRAAAADHGALVEAPSFRGQGAAHEPEGVTTASYGAKTSSQCRSNVRASSG